ncbi:MAG: bifunctional hydroxymethylpyrimidine kinase/phosphomethylpyrimidine kinase [Victivallaceae bacterium]|nr:bifunctional hydroxymethylpyrimidine kinase/phosphomethylpyrimidine kinase [Victivallaceae bacterium]MDD4179999.1 bifunctional hydroxymethylpyrimidine kinase/phosphomethylpyrimidine kinase [Victivallaceae bacterium]
MNSKTIKRFPSALTIAGSDSGGGAGIQADLRTFNAFNIFGYSAICAVTAQNPLKVSEIALMSPGSVTAQINAVREVFSPGAVKTGMLGSGTLIKAVAEALVQLDVPLIVDPVVIASSGAALLPADAVNTLCKELLPLATWITPNIPEAEALSGVKINSIRDLEPAARRFSEIWDCGCILKGGHLPSGDISFDVVCMKEELYELSSPIVKISGNTAHGTGCTLSAAFAAGLARGATWQDAIKDAKTFVYGSLRENIQLGELVCAMYPPKKNWSDEIIMRPIIRGER